MSKIAGTFRFTDQASHPRNAIALIYDLGGFSRFFNQPDVQDYVPAFLNHVSEAIQTCLFSGVEYWIGRKKNTLLAMQVVHEKFLGDGALYIVMPPLGQSNFNPQTLRALCNRLWNLKSHFEHVVQKSLERVPVVEVPQRIRFGVSRGAVYELKKAGSTSKEYIGFCINQASRLQKYCPDLGFIASARMMIPDALLAEHGYRKVVATGIKGFPNEIVIVDEDEYDGLSAGIRKRLFKDSV